MSWTIRGRSVLGRTSASAEAPAMEGSEVSRIEFEDLVRQTIDALPDWLAPAVAETAVLVEDLPAADGP